MQLTSLSRICDAYQGISAAECNFAAEALEIGVKQAAFKEGLVSLPEDGRRLCSFDWLGLEGLAPGFASLAKRAS